MSAASPDIAAPVTGEEFAVLMAGLGDRLPGVPYAVAVSGGADSLALTLLLADWLRGAGRDRASLTALTVDHGLRAESGAEAALVGQWMAKAGIDHRILRWKGAGGANLQARAREARYRLLGDWCRQHDIAGLFVAHHQDDQAETFLLRLARGSGVDGLSAMAPVSQRSGICLLRPLLNIPKARLLATLDARHQPWIEDPGNASPSFARNRLRALMPKLAREGLGAGRLAAAAASMRRARAALEHDTARSLSRCARIDGAGYALLDSARMGAQPLEIRLRVLAALLGVVSGNMYRPRLKGLHRLESAIAAAGFRGQTLAGCRVGRSPKTVAGNYDLLISRELRAIPGARPLDAGQSPMLWDNRFRVAWEPPLVPCGAPLLVGRLGRRGIMHLRRLAASDVLAAIPPSVRPSLPALRRGDELVAVPQAGFSALPAGATFSAEFCQTGAINEWLTGGA